MPTHEARVLHAENRRPTAWETRRVKGVLGIRITEISATLLESAGITLAQAYTVQCGHTDPERRARESYRSAPDGYLRACWRGAVRVCALAWHRGTPRHPDRNVATAPWRRHCRNWDHGVPQAAEKATAKEDCLGWAGGPLSHRRGPSAAAGGVD